jgi:hypothetical protein
MALTSMVSRILITGRDFRQSMALEMLVLKRIRDMKQGATIVTLMTRILKKKNKFKRSITPIALILKEMTNYKKMPQTLWHEDMWLGSFRSVVRLLINKQQNMMRRFLSRAGKQEMSNARGQKRERSPTGNETGPPPTRRSQTRDLDHVGPPNLLDTITGKPWSIARLKSAHDQIRKDNDLNQLFSKCLFVADHKAMIEEDWRQFLADYSNPTIRTLPDRNTYHHEYFFTDGHHAYKRERQAFTLRELMKFRLLADGLPVSTTMMICHSFLWVKMLEVHKNCFYAPPIPEADAREVDQIYFKFERLSELPYSKIRKLSTPSRTSLKYDTDSQPKMGLGSEEILHCFNIGYNGPRADGQEQQEVQVVAEHVVVKCPYVPNEIREKIAFLKDQMTELLESTELYGGEDNENLESRAIAQATGTEEGAELPTQDLEQGYDPGEGPSTLNTERMVVLSDDVPMQQLVDTEPHQDYRGQGSPWATTTGTIGMEHLIANHEDDQHHQQK